MRKKIAVIFLIMSLIMTTLCKPYETKAALSPPVVIGALILLSGVCVACDYLHDPDKYKDLGNTMKDFANDTVENQKKLYEIEKSNFEMVMQKAVDSNVGTCLIGSSGMSYSAKQLQSQEYPEFDTWKGYKEKESEKPKKSMWDKFKMLEPFAGLLLDLFPDSSTGGSSDAEDEQLYYTGDDGYIDRETGEVSFMFNSLCMGCYGYNYTNSAAEMYTDKFHASHTYTVPNDLKENYRIGCYVSPINNNYLYYKDDDGRIQKTLYKAHANVSNFQDNSGSANGTFFDLFSVSASIYSGGGAYTDRKLTGSMYSCGYYEGKYQLKLWDSLSCNLPIFDSREHFEDYLKTGSLVGLVNGISDVAPSPTDAPEGSKTVSPVRQYVNYFSGTFSPSVMPYYVNYNIVNNWDGDTNTFNINKYSVEESDDSGVTVTPTPNLRKPTFTPIPRSDDGDSTNNYDINITNNLLIEQTNIIQNISETVNNIYNFFQIDVDVIVEDLTPDTDSKFLPLYDMITDVNKLIPQDEFEQMEGAVDPIISTLYPKITIKVPVVLDDFLSISDKKIMEEDGDKVIILCDFYDFRIYFARFRKFLQVVIYIGMFFYLMKEFSVIWSIQ